MAIGFRWKLAAGACAAAVVAMSASGAGAESLNDAIALAYQTNPALQGQRAQLRFTDENYVQARAGFLPTVNASSQGAFTWEKLGQRFNKGCTASIFGKPCVDLTPESSTLSATLTINQPIYTGGRATAAVRGAEADILAGREDLRRIEGQVMLGVIQSYVDIRRDERSLEIRKENVVVLQRQVDEARARFDVGELTRTDVAQSEAQLADAEGQLSRAQAQVAFSRAAYAAVVGQSPGTLDPEPAFEIFPATVEQAFDTAQQNNPAIRKADYSEQAAEANLSEAKSKRMPTVGLQAQYGYSQPLHPWQPELYTRSLTAGVVVTQPFFSGGALTSQIRQAVEQENFARIQHEQARRQADQDVSQFWNGLLAARANIKANEEQVRAARIAFEGARAEQQVGLRTTLEVLNAQLVLSNAELQLIPARHDEYVASASLLNTMGLLEAKNLVPAIVLEPGSHSVEQLKRAFGYIPVLEEGVSALDSVGGPKVRPLPPKVDAPISTSQP